MKTISLQTPLELVKTLAKIKKDLLMLTPDAICYYDDNMLQKTTCESVAISCGDIRESDVYFTSRYYGNVNLTKYEWKLTFLIRKLIENFIQESKDKLSENESWTLIQNSKFELIADKSTLRMAEKIYKGYIYVKTYNNELGIPKNQILSGEYKNIISAMFTCNDAVVNNLHTIKEYIIRIRELIFLYKSVSTNESINEEIKNVCLELNEFLTCLSLVSKENDVMAIRESIHNHFKSNESDIFPIINNIFCLEF